MKKICILHANCQGEPLEELFKLSDGFNSEFDLHRYTNYTRDHIPEKILSECDLFLFQTLSEAWGEHSSEKLCAGLKKTARSIAIPNMLFKHYWPLWSGAPGFNYRDIFLDTLLEKKLSESQILHLFLNTRLTNIYDLKKIIAKSEQIEREKEKLTPVKYVDWVLENYTQKPLFMTINHPGRELLVMTANALLGELGIAPLTEQDLENFQTPFADFEQPIHPQVTELLGLEFLGPEHRYHVYGAELTFEEYAMRYIKCRMSGIDDFIGFLTATATMEKS
jgi:hypothetical protein